MDNIQHLVRAQTSRCGTEAQYLHSSRHRAGVATAARLSRAELHARGPGLVDFQIAKRIRQGASHTTDAGVETCCSPRLMACCLSHPNSGEPKPLPYRPFRGQVHTLTRVAPCFPCFGTGVPHTCIWFILVGHF